MEGTSRHRKPPGACARVAAPQSWRAVLGSGALGRPWRTAQGTRTTSAHRQGSARPPRPARAPRPRPPPRHPPGVWSRRGRAHRAHVPWPAPEESPPRIGAGGARGDVVLRRFGGSSALSVRRQRPPIASGGGELRPDGDHGVFELAGVRVERIVEGAEAVTVEAAPVARGGACPRCGRAPGRVHSRYDADAAGPARLRAPGAGAPEGAALRVPGARVPPPHVRRAGAGATAPRRRATVRLEGVLAAFCAALGGEAGARLAGRIGVAAGRRGCTGWARRAGCSASRGRRCRWRRRRAGSTPAKWARGRRHRRGRAGVAPRGPAPPRAAAGAERGPPPAGRPRTATPRSRGRRGGAGPRRGRPRVTPRAGHAAPRVPPRPTP